MQGTTLLSTICQIASGIVEMNSKEILNHIFNNKLFNYYVFVASKDIEGLGENIPILIYQDYYDIYEELEVQRQKQGIAGN